VSGKHERQLAARTLRRIARTGDIRQPGENAVLVDREPRPSRDFIAPTENARGFCRKHRHRHRGSREKLVTIRSDDERSFGMRLKQGNE
jgi:hypothetical protein